MNTREHFQRMFAYDGWANRACLSAMGNDAGGSAEIVRRMAHILSAEKLWLERLRRDRPSLPVWPRLTVQECAALAEEINAQWRQYLNELSDSAFAETVEYRNSKGEAWSNRVDDILTHVVVHSAYHRGQIALEMRSAGVEPAYTDFIHAVRQGLVE
jgi:uncharacterized damage-inducible protein DinB